MSHASLPPTPVTPVFTDADAQPFATSGPAPILPIYRVDRNKAVLLNRAQSRRQAMIDELAALRAEIDQLQRLLNAG